MTKTKVFVGNLSFQTREDELADEFQEKAGKVVRANIITRGPRSLGYGFVEFETEEAAEHAVKVMDKITLDGRQINVEVAKAREERPAASSTSPVGTRREPVGEAGEVRPRRRPRRPRAAPGAVSGGASTSAAAAPGGFRRRTRPSYVRRERTGEEGWEAKPAASRDSEQEGGVAHKRRRRSTGGSAGAVAGERRPRPPRPERAKVPSVSTLFVANLPFSLDDAALGKLFEKFKVKSAHVVRKPNNRSKGFGFVEFDAQEDQLAALAAVDKTKVEERELSVKVALTPVVEKEGEGVEKHEDAKVESVESKE